ncbi:MAG: glutamate-1-semialdehyde 2,1-aminomutase [Chloroflexi bacterium]|nr:MAG: glutamate-1-semialdehyde 2,1-aminomutase [Chloroflexota bacterium]
MSHSHTLYQEAQQLLPGGVNSPVRAFRGVGGEPIFIDSARGPYLFDVDGNRYLDYVQSWGPMILGHAHASVVEAVIQASKRGFSFGAPTEAESELAKLVIESVPSIEMVRFVNSGTEATMSALRLARAYTGRHKIIKFSGCYHGHADMLLVQAGSEPGFLDQLRSLTKASGALLIFDEVMTGFRVALGGMQERVGITPDLTCLGKIIGGGLPVGAYGGRREIMEQVAPLGAMYQAGTLSGNPLAMAAGIATLTEMRKPGQYEELERKSQMLGDGLERVINETGVELQFARIGAMFCLYFTGQPVTDYASAKSSDTASYAQYFWNMLARGIYLPPSQFEACFISLALDDEMIEETIESARLALSGEKP